ncbi:MAG: tetratricopeptide repeat protein, partial [Alphaproteobacteria bacterium]|nr:tetratricopeptide repeat protein [Alphaproteobacteria bacterium]
ALNNLAVAQQEIGNFEAAQYWYDRAITLYPERVEIFYNYGNFLQSQRRFDEAVVALQRSLEISPDFGPVHSRLALALMQTCQWANLSGVISRAIEYTEKELSSATGRASISAWGLFVFGASLDLVDRVCRRNADTLSDRLAEISGSSSFSYSERQDDRIRLGYISPDFRDHSVGISFKGVLANHDPERFEIFGYSIATHPPDHLTTYFENTFDHWTDFRLESDLAAATAINEDGIDILIDLAGLTGNARLPILALRPAPIQVHFLGYANTMGAEYIDYIISDQDSIPEEKLNYFRENIVFLPENSLPVPLINITENSFHRSDFDLPEKAFVFACFNAHFKIEPEMYTVWMRLLREISGSVLWLIEGNPSSRENLMMEAERLGVAHDRLIFAGTLPQPEHVARHTLADLALDTLVVSGGATTIDALWAGLPVVVVMDPRFDDCTRVNILKTAELPNLVTYSLDEYYQLALDLAIHPKKLAAISQRLKQSRDQAPLFDVHRFTRHLEIGYEKMHEAHIDEDGTDHIFVAPLSNNER